MQSCPSCQRFVGPVAECPYCTSPTREHPGSPLLRLGALVLALAGLSFLFLMSLDPQPPQIRANDISPVMNFATVRISGTVPRDPYLSKQNGRMDYLSFVVNDGTGELRVCAYDQTARNLADNSRLPAQGDTISVCGTLNITAGRRPKLTIRRASDMEIMP